MANRRPATILVAMIFVWTTSAATAPLEIKGIRMGMTTEQASAALEGFVCKNDLCTLIPKSYVQDACRIGGSACKEYLEGELQFGPARVEIYVGHPVNGRIGRVTAQFSQIWFADVASALTKKYGKPSAALTQSMQNAFGAKFSNRVLVWRQGDNELRLEERPEVVDESYATLSAGWFDRAARDADAKKTETDAKKL